MHSYIKTRLKLCKSTASNILLIAIMSTFDIEIDSQHKASD